MDRIIDEIVKVSVTDAVAAATATAVNTVAVLGISSKTGVGVKFSQEDVETAYKASGSDLDKVTASFFLEDNPGKVVCIPTAEEPTADTIGTLLDAAMDLGTDEEGNTIDFYHVVVRLAPAGETTEAKATAAKAVIDALETWCETNFRMGHVEIADRETAIAVGVKYKAATAPSRVAIYAHSETNGRSLAAAIVADRCASDPARGTWAHKTLSSLNADAISTSALNSAKTNGVNVYCKVAGVNRMFFGSIAGTDSAFIDEVIKKDWLKFRTQEAVFNILGSANNGDGVDYNDAGIAAIASAINNIFTTAADNDHRYIMEDSFEVQVPKYADIAADQKKIRNLPDVKVPFSIQGSIHTVKTIELQVVEA